MDVTSKALYCLAIVYILGGAIPLAHAQQQHPQTTMELLRGSLALQRDITTAQQSAREAAEPDRIRLILDADGALPFMITHIQLTLDGDTIVDRALNEADNSALQRGAMIPLFDGSLARGKHRLTATVTATGNVERQRQKRFKFDKPQHADILRLSVTNPLLGKAPGISMQLQHRGTAK